MELTMDDTGSSALRIAIGCELLGGAEILRLRAINTELVAALQESIETVRVFHGPLEWETYRDHSPEMKRWNEAIQKATGAAS